MTGFPTSDSNQGGPPMTGFPTYDPNQGGTPMTGFSLQPVGLQMSGHPAQDADQGMSRFTPMSSAAAPMTVFPHPAANPPLSSSFPAQDPNLVGAHVGGFPNPPLNQGGHPMTGFPGPGFQHSESARPQSTYSEPNSGGLLSAPSVIDEPPMAEFRSFGPNPPDNPCRDYYERLCDDFSDADFSSSSVPFEQHSSNSNPFNDLEVASICANPSNRLLEICNFPISREVA